MKISELISGLQKVLESDGDLTVLVRQESFDGEDEDSWLEEVDSLDVTVTESGAIVDLHIL